MKYTLKEIKELRKKMTPPMGSEITEENFVAVDAAPYIIDQLLEEREELKKKIEQITNGFFCFMGRSTKNLVYQ